MIEAMEKRGHRLKDDNQADALALLYWRLEQGGAAAHKKKEF